LETFADCLKLFDAFAGDRLLVPGNHCIWCREGESSLDRYEKALPDVAADAGFSVLDHNPLVRGDLGLVGSIGWYDYSFAEKSLGIPEDFYREKLAPGAAAYLGTHRSLLEAHEAALTQRHYSIGARWMDGVRVKLGMSDEEFTTLLVKKLAEQLQDVASRAERIVAFVHHLPFAELVPRNRPDKFAFAAAYMGSGRFGKVLLDCDKVSDIYCGHSHWPMRTRIGQINVVNVGSTYVEKRIEILEV